LQVIADVFFHSIGLTVQSNSPRVDLVDVNLSVDHGPIVGPQNRVCVWLAFRLRAIGFESNYAPFPVYSRTNRMTRRAVGVVENVLHRVRVTSYKTSFLKSSLLVQSQ